MDLLIAGAKELGVGIDARQVRQFEMYYREMLEGNSRMSLTGVTDWEETQTRHFVDSLSVAAALPRRMFQAGEALMDVGSGGGLPGVPLKIAYPEVSVTLLEANGKKAAFLRRLVEVLGLSGVSVVRGRAEEAGHRPELRERFGLVVSRAVARLDALAELTLPFCRVGGTTIAQKGPDVRREVDLARNAIEALGGGDVRVIEARPAGSPAPRTLVAVSKARPTPKRFPRRPGIPSKRPL